MTQFFDFAFYSAKFFTADFAVNHRFIGTFFRAGGFYCVFDYDFAFGVAECINNGLRNKNFSADGAMLTLGKTGFGAGGCDCFVDHFGMTERINNGLRNKDFSADGAMFSFRKSGFGASGCDCFVNNFGVTECVNNGLFNKNFSADGAVFAFRKSGFGTSGSDCFVDYFGMTQFFDFAFYSAKFFAADFAVNHGFIGAFFRAGGFYCVFDYDLAFGVAEGINNGLCNKNFSADGAMLAFRKTGFGAGGSDCFINNFGMRKFFFYFGFSAEFSFANRAIYY